MFVLGYGEKQSKNDKNNFEIPNLVNEEIQSNPSYILGEFKFILMCIILNFHIGMGKIKER